MIQRSGVTAKGAPGLYHTRFHPKVSLVCGYGYSRRQAKSLLLCPCGRYATGASCGKDLSKGTRFPSLLSVRRDSGRLVPHGGHRSRRLSVLIFRQSLSIPTPRRRKTA